MKKSELRFIIKEEINKLLRLILKEQYTCWNCGLKQGSEDTPEEESRLCPACKKSGVKY